MSTAHDFGFETHGCGVRGTGVCVVCGVLFAVAAYADYAVGLWQGAGDGCKVEGRPWGAGFDVGNESYCL